MLVPSYPGDDLADRLNMYQVTVIWPTGNGFQRRDDSKLSA